MYTNFSFVISTTQAGVLMWSDNETAIDLLGFQYLTKAVCRIVKNEHLLSATIGVYGAAVSLA